MSDDAQQDPGAEARRGYPAEKARQGHIVLRSRRRRWIFFGGLVGFVVLALIVRLSGYA